MTTNEDQDIEVAGTTLEIMWRNPLSLVQELLKAREESHPHYRWAEYARKIRARRVKWNVNHRGAA